MKTFFTSVALVLVCSFFTVFSQDYMIAQRQNFKLKYIAEELSASGSLFFKLEDYSEGYIVFNDNESLKAMSKQIKDLMHLDDSYKPLSKSYWIDPVQWTAYFYDDSNICRVYKNNVLISQFIFTYPYLHEDQDTLFTEVITEPTVVVTINAGKSRFRIPEFKNTPPNIRSAAHEWKGK